MGRYYDIEYAGHTFKLASVTTQIMELNKLGLFGERIVFPHDSTALDTGTEVHDMIRRINQGKQIGEDEWFKVGEQTRQAVRAEIRWNKLFNFKPRYSEVIVYSLVHAYAGTIDCVGTIGRRCMIVDYKTGVVNHEYVNMQLTLYYMAYKEMYPRRKVSGLMVVQLNKQDGSWNTFSITTEDAINTYFPQYLKCKKEAGLL